MMMVHWQNKFVYTCPLLGKDQSQGRIWLFKAWGLVLVIDWTPWWGSQYFVPVSAEQISLNVSSSHQVTQLPPVTESNLLIGFCTGFAVKTWVEWELSLCHWQSRLWMQQGGGKHILSSVDLSNLAAWWLCSPVALWWAQDGSVWASVLRDVPHVSFHHPLHRSSKSCSLVFWKGLISWRESGVFFPFFSSFDLLQMTLCNHSAQIQRLWVKSF